MSEEQLEIEAIIASEGQRTLVLRGELDLSTAGTLEEALREACEAGSSEVVVDLREVDFIDSAGLRAIIVGRDFCAARDCAYVLVPSSKPIIRRLFMISGLDEDLPFREGGGNGLVELTGSADDQDPTPA